MKEEKNNVILGGEKQIYPFTDVINLDSVDPVKSDNLNKGFDISIQNKKEVQFVDLSNIDSKSLLNIIYELDLINIIDYLYMIKDLRNLKEATIIIPYMYHMNGDKNFEFRLSKLNTEFVISTDFKEEDTKENYKEKYNTRIFKAKDQNKKFTVWYTKIK